MNKQELAAKIWASANQMRSKIEANEYKDYILGFIFYKYLSEKEIQFAKKEGSTDDDIKELKESNKEAVKYVQSNIGYFIDYKNLFSTWIEKERDFDISNVRDALSAFSRLINPAHKKVFDKIFDTLQTGLSKLGETSAAQTKAASGLIQLIKDIPMDGKQGYDVLGFIYEYLIGMFAANAGKKAGEFYTPHEVSFLMSEIVADHLKNKKEIQIYDPTSGSGSLLINIGRSVGRHVDDENNIKYFAQELKQNTYNLTRMNLVMRGILVDNIETRNGDTLEDDWPYFEENDPINTYNPLYVDAVVSNPPYSQKWDPKNKENDPRYTRFGLAPKTKADYAFLLHDLFHLKPEGIMAIVLPHGVLFRGGEEGNIRKNLIENNHIDTIIGLPPNIFFGTTIPTIVMILKQKRKNTDVLIVDASKGFTKVGKNNQLRASDIKKITDTVIARKTIAKYSRVVEREEIRNNEHNLNIPRYVDSSASPESWDIYASMFGGIPKSEIDTLSEYWNAFPNLRSALFKNVNNAYSELKTQEIKTAIEKHPDVKAFIEQFESSFKSFTGLLKKKLISGMNDVKLSREETFLSEDIFKRLKTISLIDKYDAYQILDDRWQQIAVDIEILQTEGFSASKIVKPNMVSKKKGDDTYEVQDGWMGHVIPFQLVQETYLKDEYLELRKKEESLVEITSELQEIIESFTEEEKDLPILNDGNDGFVVKEISNTIKDFYEDVESEEINALKGYIELLNQKGSKTEKEEYIKSHLEVKWTGMNASKDGTYAKSAVSKYLNELYSQHSFPEDSFESKIIGVSNLLAEEKNLKSDIKIQSAQLHLKTKDTIENLTDDQVKELLELKWIVPMVNVLHQLPQEMIHDLEAQVDVLAKKYAVTYEEVVDEIHKTEKALSSLMNELTGSDFDMKGIKEFQTLMAGE